MTKAICFIDLDGVLADFVGGALRFHGREDLLQSEVQWGLEEQLGLTKDEFWNGLGESFWSGLAPTPEMTTLLLLTEELFGRDNIHVCTSPCLTPGCAVGKVRWVEKYLPSSYSRRLHLNGDKSVLAAPGRVLIDDHDSNCTAWRMAGGVECLVPRSWNSFRHLSGDVVGTVRKRLERILGR